MSRYYDPIVGRFINADSFASTGQGVLGYNMYAYCGNNPVMYADPSGTMHVKDQYFWGYVSIVEEKEEKSFLEKAGQGIVDFVEPAGKTVLTAAIFFGSFEFSAGAGFGFGASATIEGANVTAVMKHDLVSAKLNVDEFDIGSEVSATIGVGVGPAELSVGPSKFTSYLDNEITSSELSGNFTIISVDAYFIIGASGSVSFRAEPFLERTTNIWKEDW